MDVPRVLVVCFSRYDIDVTQRQATFSALKSMAAEMDRRTARGPGGAASNEPPAEEVSGVQNLLDLDLDLVVRLETAVNFTSPHF